MIFFLKVAVNFKFKFICLQSDRARCAIFGPVRFCRSGWKFYRERSSSRGSVSEQICAPSPCCLTRRNWDSVRGAGWGPEGWAPKEEGPKGANISLFFSISRSIFALFFALGGLFVELRSRTAAMDHPKCAFGLLRGHFV